MPAPSIVSFAALVIAFVLVADHAQAQATRAPVRITIENARTVTLTGLVLSRADGAEVSALGQPLAAGKKAQLRLPRNTPCSLQITARFEDEAINEAGAIDICAEKSFRFVD